MGVRKVTAQQVAEYCGVSLAAVSRAFSAEGRISAEKRDAILQAARKLGYISPQGRTLKQLSTGAISLVVGDLQNPFYTSVVYALSKELYGRGKRLVLHTIPPGASIDDVMQQVLASHSEAVIVASVRMSSQIARSFRKERRPVVLFNRIQPDADMAAVTCDNYGGGRRIAQHLLDRGCQRIGHVIGLADTSTHLERTRGFCDPLAEAGQAPFITVEGGFDYNIAHAALKEALPTLPQIDALFCENDAMALAAIDVARALGRIPGGDLAIVGFDDIPQASWTSYQLTTLQQPVEAMVLEALALIEQLIEVPEKRGLIRVLSGNLISRATG